MPKIAANKPPPLLFPVIIVVAMLKIMPAAVARPDDGIILLQHLPPSPPPPPPHHPNHLSSNIVRSSVSSRWAPTGDLFSCKGGIDVVNNIAIRAMSMDRRPFLQPSDPSPSNRSKMPKMGTLEEESPKIMQKKPPGKYDEVLKIRATRKCDCKKGSNKMTKITFKSDVENKLKKTVKVALKEGAFAGGGQAKVYNGCFVKKCVAVKLIGRETIESLRMEQRQPSAEQIIEDAKKEVEKLEKIKEEVKKDESKGKYIIHIFDGGEIELIGKKNEWDGDLFKYVEILELGGDNFIETFIKRKAELGEFSEEQFMNMMSEGAETVMGIHGTLIHTDIKPQNMVYVEERKPNQAQKSITLLKRIESRIFHKNPTMDFEIVTILKGIDYGGAIILSELAQGKSIDLNGFSTTKQFLPPEMDGWFKMKISDGKGRAGMMVKLTATTKSDMWQFGMMIYNLLLVQLYPGKDFFAIAKELGRINNLYKWFSEWTHDKFDYENLSEYNDGHAFTTILEIRAKYPRLHMLISNLLNKNANERLSAKGAYEYLRMECDFGRELKEKYKTHFGNTQIRSLLKLDAEYGIDAGVITFGDRILAEMLRNDEAERKLMEGNWKECDRSYRNGF